MGAGQGGVAGKGNRCIALNLYARVENDDTNMEIPDAFKGARGEEDE